MSYNPQNVHVVKKKKNVTKSFMTLSISDPAKSATISDMKIVSACISALDK